MDMKNIERLVREIQDEFVGHGGESDDTEWFAMNQLDAWLELLQEYEAWRATVRKGSRAVDAWIGELPEKNHKFPS